MIEEHKGNEKDNGSYKHRPRQYFSIKKKTLTMFFVKKSSKKANKQKQKKHLFVPYPNDHNHRNSCDRPISPLLCFIKTHQCINNPQHKGKNENDIVIRETDIVKNRKSSQKSDQKMHPFYF